MELRTNILFYLLIKNLAPELICDVGSCDGYNSIRFRRFSPRSKIIAFEANPYNFKRMQADKVLAQCDVNIVNKAISNKEGEVIFHVEAVRGIECRAGISSLRERQVDSNDREDVMVSTIRLDKYIQSLNTNFEHIALWIDVEGMGYEVLDGIDGIKDKVSLIHIEVETEAFWKGQYLKPDVERLMENLGFQFLDRGMPEEQHNLVYVNKNLLNRFSLKFRIITAAAYLCSFLQTIQDMIKPRK